MKHTQTIATVFLLASYITQSTLSYGLQDVDCKILSTELVKNEFLRDSPEEPGNYCLPEDVTAYRSIGGSAEGVMLIESSDVSLDLQGHQIYGKSKGKKAVSQYTSKQYPLIQRVAIYNGILKSYNVEGLLFGGLNLGYIFASDHLGFVDRKEREQDTGYLEIANQGLIKFRKELTKIRDNFPLTEHTIDNVKVSAENIGIGIKGGGNIIRNNVIMIGENDIKWLRTPQQVYDDPFNNAKWGGGTASIYLFGPNQLIENNIIIFKGKTRTSNSSAAPIKLHAADGTIIRNNTIIVESSGQDVPQTAISIFDSKNVVIENNQIFGTKSVYKIWDKKEMGSSVKETGTSFPPIWKKPSPKF